MNAVISKLNESNVLFVMLNIINNSTEKFVLFTIFQLHSNLEQKLPKQFYKLSIFTVDIHFIRSELKIYCQTVLAIS